MTKPNLSWNDMLTLLERSPGAKPEKQIWIEKTFNVQVPRANYETMCSRLVEKLGQAAAERAVLDTVLDLAKPALLDVLAAAADGDYLPLRATEPAIVELLFYRSGKPKKLGQLVLGHFVRRRTVGKQTTGVKTAHPSAVQEQPPNDQTNGVAEKESGAVRGAGPSGVPRHVALHTLVESPANSALPCAQHNLGLLLIPFSIAKHKALVVEPQTEDELEKTLIKEWQNIDFGESEQLLLAGSQVKVSERKAEKVDLVARTLSGKWYAIELKNDAASGNDLTQLFSYMRDIEFSLRIDSENVYGILIAPSFGEKVVNAAGIDSRVRLLAYVTKE